MMIVSWNIRGLGTGVKVSVVREIIRKSRVNVCFIQESKLESIFEDLIRKMWYNDNYEFRFSVARGSSGGLISIWDKDVFQVTSDYCVDRVIVLVGKWKLKGMDATLINIYAPNVIVEQKDFWGVLLELRK